MKSFWFAFTALLICACGDGSSYLSVTVASATPLMVNHLDVTIQNGTQSATLSIRHGASFSIPPEQTFNLKLDPSRRGDLTVDVRAVGVSGVLAEKSSGAAIVPGGTAHLVVTFGGAADAGVPPDMTKLPPPVITSAFPDRGSTAGGTRISLMGENFFPGFSITVAGVPASDLRWDKKTQITFTMPPKPGIMGPVPVVVTNSDGQSATNGKALSYFPGTLGFLEPKAFAVGAGAVTIATADLDRDGNLDLVTGNIQSSDVSVLQGKPDGTFGQEVRLTGGKGTAFVAIADLNRDGLPEIIANDSADSIAIFTNRGNLQFQPIAFVPAGTRPGSIATGDFNRDGNVDLIVLHYSTDSGSILLGDGSGTFGAPSWFPTGKSPDKVIVADLNAQGRPGAVIADSGDNDALLLAGNGDGTLREVTRLPTGAGPQGLQMIDLNHDKLLDVVTSSLNDSTISVSLNGGLFGMWTRKDYKADSGTRDVAVGDFNGDGNADLVAANGSFIFGPPSADTISVLLGNGDGSFQPGKSFAAHGSPQNIVIADFDKDGRQDIAVANTQGQVAIFLNSSQ